MPALLVEAWDFSKPLFGDGQSSIADSAIRTLGNKIKLVGVTSGSVVGRWTKVEHYGVQLDFLPVIHAERMRKPRFLASRVDFAVAVARYMPRIREANVRAVLTRTYPVLWLFALRAKQWDICFYAPGLFNPLVFGRKPGLGKVLASLYERIQARAVGRTTITFAAASRPAVREYMQLIERLGVKKEVHPLPTAVDLERFRPRPKQECRQELGLPAGVPIFTFVGRLANQKGIPLLIEALKQVHRSHPGALLLLVGEGEQRKNLERMVQDLGLHDQVRFLGLCPPARVSAAVGAADACVFGSLTEGFSNAMVEQVACGRPVVSTAVSGADELVIEGKNGFIVRSRNPVEFGARMLDALNLPEAERVSRELAVEKYSEKMLWQRMADAWPPLR